MSFTLCQNCGLPIKTDQRWNMLNGGFIHAKDCCHESLMAEVKNLRSVIDETNEALIDKNHSYAEALIAASIHNRDK